LGTVVLAGADATPGVGAGIEAEGIAILSTGATGATGAGANGLAGVASGAAGLVASVGAGATAVEMAGARAAGTIASVDAAGADASCAMRLAVVAKSKTRRERWAFMAAGR